MMHHVLHIAKGPRRRAIPALQRRLAALAFAASASLASWACVSPCGDWLAAKAHKEFRVAYPRDRISLVGGKRLLVASESRIGRARCELLLGGRAVKAGSLRDEGRKWGFENYSFELDAPLPPGRYRLSVEGAGSSEFSLEDRPLDVVSIIGSFWAFQRASSEKCRVEGEFDYQGNHHVAEIGLPEVRASNWSQDEERLVERSGDLSGGWHDATSTDKDTFDEAGVVAMLGISCQTMGNGPDRDAVLSEMAWGVDYLLRIQNPSGSFPFAVDPYLPWEKTKRPRRLVVNELPGVAANAARALAVASSELAPGDPEKSAACLSAARRAFAWAQAHTDRFGLVDLPCMWTGGAVSLLDAASELYRATGEAPYALYAKRMVDEADFRDLVFSRRASDPRIPSGPNGAGGPGGFPGQFDPSMNFFETSMLQPAVALCRFREIADAPERATIDALLRRFVDQVSAGCANPYGIYERALDPTFGPDIYLAAIAHSMAWIAMATGDERAARIAKDHYAWNLGRNPWGSSFYFGIGGECAIEPYGRTPGESYGALLPGPLLQKSGKLSFEHPPYEEWRVREAGIGAGNSTQFLLDAILTRMETASTAPATGPALP
jgi:hypothetical protein